MVHRSSFVIVSLCLFLCAVVVQGYESVVLQGEEQVRWLAEPHVALTSADGSFNHGAFVNDDGTSVIQNMPLDGAYHEHNGVTCARAVRKELWDCMKQLMPEDVRMVNPDTHFRVISSGSGVELDDAGDGMKECSTCKEDAIERHNFSSQRLLAAVREAEMDAIDAATHGVEDIAFDEDVRRLDACICTNPDFGHVER